jgi:PPP family 3-phenylpropionic acid transporter
VNAEPAFRAAPFSALWFCYFATVGLFSPYAPLWLSHLGYSTLAIGAFVALQSWTRVLAPYGWGWLADHGGRRVALLRLAAALSLLAAGGMWLVGDLGAWPLALTMALLFLANGAVTPIGETLLLRHLHGGAGLDARRYGRVRLWGSIGFIVSVLLVGVALQGAGIGAFPLLLLVLFALLLLAAIALPRIGDTAPHSAAREPVWPVLRRPAVLWFFAGTMLTVLAHAALYGFFSLYLRQLGYDKPAIGAMWAVGVVAEVIFFAFAGRLFARLTDHHWLVLAALATAVRFALTAAYADVPVVLALLQTSHALTFAAQHMACTSVIARHFPDRLRARGSALYATLGYGVPGVLGGLGGGWVSDAFGLGATFVGAALVALAAAVCCAIAARADNAIAAS